MVHHSIGCDIVHIPRIKKIMEDEQSLQRVFQPSELSNLEPQHLAGIFAAKEAAFKALAIPSNQWLEIEVSHTDTGKPILTFSATILDASLYSIACSISHDQDYAVAVVSVLQHS